MNDGKKSKSMFCGHFNFVIVEFKIILFSICFSVRLVESSTFLSLPSQLTESGKVTHHMNDR